MSKPFRILYVFDTQQKALDALRQRKAFIREQDCGYNFDETKGQIKYFIEEEEIHELFYCIASLRQAWSVAGCEFCSIRFCRASVFPGDAVEYILSRRRGASPTKWLPRSL